MSDPRPTDRLFGIRPSRSIMEKMELDRQVSPDLFFSLIVRWNLSFGLPLIDVPTGDLRARGLRDSDDSLCPWGKQQRNVQSLGEPTAILWTGRHATVASVEIKFEKKMPSHAVTCCWFCRTLPCNYQVI